MSADDELDFQQRIKSGDVVRRADGLYVERGSSRDIATGKPAPSNVNEEFGSEVAGVFFRADSAARHVLGLGQGCEAAESKWPYVYSMQS